MRQRLVQGLSDSVVMVLLARVSTAVDRMNGSLLPPSPPLKGVIRKIVAPLLSLGPADKKTATQGVAAKVRRRNDAEHRDRHETKDSSSL